MNATATAATLPTTTIRARYIREGDTLINNGEALHVCGVEFTSAEFCRVFYLTPDTFDFFLFRQADMVTVRADY